jgi:hypothetical protein
MPKEKINQTECITYELPFKKQKIYNESYLREGLDISGVHVFNFVVPRGYGCIPV